MKRFSSPLWWRRLLVALALVLSFGLVLALAGALCRLTGGYGAAQYQSSLWLADHADKLESWRAAAGRDLFPYIAIYLAFGIGVYVWVLRRPWAAVALLVIGGLFDVLETLRFRGTLDRLLAGTDPIHLVDRTTSTAMLSGAKWACGAAAGLVAIYEIVRRPDG